MLTSGVQLSFACIENKAPLSCLCPTPTTSSSPRILWAVAHLERLGLNSKGERGGRGEICQDRRHKEEKKRPLARITV